MAELTLTNADLSTLDVDALVVGAVRTADTVTLVGADTLPEDVRTRLVTAAKTLALSGAADEVRRLPADPRLKAPVLVITGLGDAAGAGDPEVLRRAAGAATRELVRVPRVAVSLPAADDASLAAVAEGALIGSYAFDTYRTPDEPPTAAVVVVTPLAGSAPAEAVATRARVVAQAVHTVRDLVNTAPNDLFPAAFADRAKAEAKSAGIKATVLDEKALASGGYGGLVNVGKGSERGPRLVKVVYAPAKPAARVALVGKGITFDSGGVSIKPAKGMEAMKSDMAGAAAVLATVVAAATLELSVAVTGYLCLAENMPS
ncbi:MAG: leucyl aminopeptidase family protein, partial [Cellulomonadaceae bacterium]